MATIARIPPKRTFGPRSNGTLMSPDEFDKADFEGGWRYELINGVLIVSPIPSRSERDPNEELGYLLRSYQQRHPKGYNLNLTLQEETIETISNRRRADRVIWAGLGRLPRAHEVPTIIAEFVSPGKRNRERDYQAKRKEYREIGVQEYWVIDRFARTLTVFIFTGGRYKKRVIREDQVYTTNLLPGFELPVAQLLALAERWPDQEQESN
jgi:Uma2 family endonuclease